nr:serine dehydratase beta chain [Granulicella sp. dw_53]
MNFASAFSGAPAGFSPTSVLIEIFGGIADPAHADRIAAGVLLGLAGQHPSLTAEHALALLDTIRVTKSFQLNGAIEVPFSPEEHLIVTPTALQPSQPDGIRLTAYHCVHPFVTRQYHATGRDPLSFTEC